VQCYVNNPTLTVTWTVSPDSPCTAPNCHIEYCLSTTAPVSGYLACGHQWQHKKAAQSFPLPNTNATYSVYGEYKVIRAAAVGPDTAAKSTASTPFYVTLNTGAPSVTPATPAGLLQDDGVTTQTQQINGTEAQWVTFNAFGDNGETITTQVNICPSSGSCTQLGSSSAVTQFAWQWNPTPDSSTSVKPQATDQAATVSQTVTVNPAVLFNPNTSPASVTCTSSACSTLAGQGSMEMLDDPPSNVCGNSTFSGYADPSMRGDSFLTTANSNGPPNPFGTNLYILYSWLTCQTPDNGVTYVPVLETHLAYSNAPEGVGGPDWTAWCTPFSTCSGYTPIFSSVPSSIITGNSAYTSHEVPNMWAYVDTTNNTESWYAAHLMYVVYNCGGFGNLPSNYTRPPGQSQNPNSLSKFDWAVRSDGTSLIALATPEYVSAGGVVTDYQCVAMDFTLPQGVPGAGQPFTKLLATVYDTDASESSPGACTYDPTSNTGIVVVRRSGSSSGDQLNAGTSYQFSSIINSGVLP
jgi:hypothetical protein